MCADASCNRIYGCEPTLGRWQIHIINNEFSLDQRKGAFRNVAYKLSRQER